MATERLIMWFSKKNDALIGEEEIRKFDLKKFIRLFNHDDDDDPYMDGGCYQVEKEHLKEIQSHIKHRINLRKYDYFFGTYEAEED